MSVNAKVVDARGLSCPQPVLETKRAVENAEKDKTPEISVLVDTVTSSENVKRFAASAGWKTSDEAEGDHFRVNLKKG